MRTLKWRYILVIFVFIWTVLLFEFVIHKRKQDTADSDANLTNRLNNVLYEIEELRKSNVELDAQLKNLKLQIQKLPYKKDSKNRELNAPSQEYELLRRRIFSNTKELWYYINSELRSLNNGSQIYAERVNKIKNMVDEHYRSLSKDISDLAEFDNYLNWRTRESNDLSNLIQNRLKILQNPPDCNKAKKLFCNLKKVCGYGCLTHHIVYCLIVAYATKRTLILDSNKWIYSEEGWQNIFLPLSDTCNSLNSRENKTIVEWPGDQNNQVIYLPMVDKAKLRPPFIPLTLPKDLATRLKTLHGDPAVWWVGQFLKYILRPQPKIRDKLEEYANKMKFKKPIVGVHIRRTDKIGSEAAFHKLEEYMIHVEEYFKLKELSGKVNKKRIYLATDEPLLFAEVRQKYPDYEIIGDQNISKTAFVDDRYSNESLDGIITDIHFLSLSDYLVCTFSSQVCRLAYEIMNSFYSDASTQYTSLDDTYYFGGQKPRINEIVLNHKATGPLEIDLKIGDQISVAGNLWNGYSDGIILRTRKSGLYPTFKAIQKIQTVNFDQNPYTANNFD